MDELTVAVFSVVVDNDILIDASRDVSDAVECLDQIEQRAALAVSVVTFGSGRTSVLQGCIHLLLFAVFLLLIFAP